MIEVRDARAILATYRPGTSDDADPAYAEALELCRRDAELARWLETQGEVDKQLRLALREIPVPHDLEARILAAAQTTRRRAAPWRWPAVLIPAAAALVLAIVAQNLWFTPPEQIRMDAYQNQMISIVAPEHFEPEIEVDNLEALRIAFVRHQWPADYHVPSGLHAIEVEGGSLLEWQGQKISLLCLETSDDLYVWMFVLDRSVLTDAPPPGVEPRIAKRGGFTTAAWTGEHRTYLVIADGDEEFLRGLLAEAG